MRADATAKSLVGSVLALPVRVKCWILGIGLAGCAGAPPPAAPPRVPITPRAAAGYACHVERPGPPLAVYASPEGSAEGDGSFGRPFELVRALSNPKRADGTAVIGPGSTLYLRGGVYRVPAATGFNSLLEGAPDRPIVIRSLPGEWAVIADARGLLPPSAKAHTVQLRGRDTELWDVEITNDSRDRHATGCDRAPMLPIGVRLSGARTRVVNSVVHDVGVGVFVDGGGEEPGGIYGSVFYNFGADVDCQIHRGAAQAMYVRNRKPRLLIADNVLVNGFHSGIQVYASSAPLDYITISGNVWANNGVSSKLTGARTGLHLWSMPESPPPRGLVIESNVGWTNPPHGVTTLQLGGAQRFELDSFADNYLVGVVWLGDGLAVKAASGNFFYGKGGSTLDPAARFPVYVAQFPDYATRKAIAGECRRYLDFVQRHPQNTFLLQAGSCGDTSAERRGPPKDNHLFIRKNRHDPHRAHVAIFNWENRSTVELDLSGILSRGQPFVIANAQNYFGTPLVTGIYEGKPVRIDMHSPALAPAQPLASAEFGEGISADEMTAPAFAALVVQGRAVSRADRDRFLTIRLPEEVAFECTTVRAKSARR